MTAEAELPSTLALAEPVPEVPNRRFKPDLMLKVCETFRLIAVALTTRLWLAADISMPEEPMVMAEAAAPVPPMETRPAAVPLSVPTRIPPQETAPPSATLSDPAVL